MNGQHALLAADPHALEQAATHLGRVEEELQAASRGAGAVLTAAPAAWAGAAGLAHRARVEELGGLVRDAAPAAGRLCVAVRCYADTVTGEQRTVLRLRDRARSAEAERRRLLAVPPDPTDPAALVLWRSRVSELEREVAAARAAIDAAVERWQEAVTGLERALRSLPPGLVPALVVAGGAVSAARRGGTLLARGARVLGLSASRARAADLAARAALDDRLARVVGTLRRVPPWLRVAGRLGPWAIPMQVTRTAVPDVVRGGGHSGWRGGITRVLAGLAIPGSVALLVPNPWAVGAGAVTVGAYYLWRAGTRVWDHRRQLSGLGRSAWDRLVATSRTLLRRSRTAAARAVRAPARPGRAPLPALAPGSVPRLPVVPRVGPATAGGRA